MRHEKRNTFYPVRYRDLAPAGLIYRFGIPLLALGQALSEASFIFMARRGIVKGHISILGWLSVWAVMRFVFQDRLAVLEMKAVREIISGFRQRLMDALRLRSVPAYRPDYRRNLLRNLDETAARVGDGFLSNERFTAAVLQALILIPCLFILSWRLALVSLILIAPAWWMARWRSRSLRNHERAATQGRVDGQLALQDFGESLESTSGGKLGSALRTLEGQLEQTRAPEWRWRLAQARYPTWLETAFFFVFAGVIWMGYKWLGGWQSWILFSGLLLLAYRPVREAARHYPISMQGREALRDGEALMRSWEGFPVRALPDVHPENALAVENVEFRYEQRREVFKEFSASFPVDKVTGITGPNGAGKTTLLRLLSSVEIPLKGRVLWAAALRRHGSMAYLPQRVSPGSDWSTWAKNLMDSKPMLWEELNSILGVKRLLEKSVHPEALSGGERQRMALARVLASDAPFLLLDEPTTALPGDERERIMEDALRLWTRPHGPDGIRRGAIIVSHELFVERLCDATFALNEKQEFTAREKQVAGS